MTRSIFAIAAVFALSGCFGSAPQDAGQMRTMSKSNVFGAQTSYKVARSYNGVVASLRKGANKCLNRNQVVRSTYRPGPMMAPVSRQMVFYYSTTMKSGRGGTEMMMRKKFQGAKLIGGGADNSGVFYLVDVKPASGGTVLNVYGGKIGYGELNAAVKQWASGGSIRCPELP